jgi:aspartate beta-hydroxylase
LINLPGLRSLPFWTNLRDDGENRIAYGDPTLQRVIQLLEDHATAIRDEYQRNHARLPSDYDLRTEHESLHQGQWDWHSYMTKGKVQAEFFQQFPDTFAVLQQLRSEGVLFEGTPFGYSFFSKLHPNSRIKPHSAPMNFRLRLHLPLIVPEEHTSDAESIACGIRVGPLVQRWTPGKAIVLDDAYEHEVWNETNQVRVLLLVDLWHPDVTQQERDDIVKMFLVAKEQGWYKT